MAPPEHGGSSSAVPAAPVPQPVETGDAAKVPEDTVAVPPVPPAQTAPGQPAEVPGGGGGGSPPADNAAETTLKAKAAAVAEATRALNDAWLKKVGLYVLAGLSVVAFVGLIEVFDYKRQGKLPWLWELSPTRRATLTAIVLIWALLVVGAIVMRPNGGLRALLIGKDGRFSTSQTQAALWTLGLGFVLSFLLLRKPFGITDDAFAGSFKQLDDVYLLMLGLPYAALVAARGITANKVDTDRLQKVTASESKIRDLVTDDDGHPALLDTQFFVFSMIALVYFVAAFAAKPDALPELPLGLVGLTGIAALAYTGNKAVTSNAPVISTVTRSLGYGPVRPGDTVDIRGANFVPEGASTEEQLANVRVRFRESEVPVIPHPQGNGFDNPARDRVTVAVPTDVSAGVCPVVVITAADKESNAFSISVVVDAPVVTGIDPAVLKVDHPVTLRGRFFRTAGQIGPATIRFGDVPVVASTEGDSVTATVPPSVRPGGSVVVRVISAGGAAESAPLTLPVSS